ncbi:hypothetical protein CDL15_Pgr003979 [Punica granatum]|uniref:Uncharacterized protein n=1 Tax=Punica granatum TaxID=22663 RepID=A0A218WPA8_PUNGR|nr:hypothetical protein CDL15_Pgr003979 [Punica granatum]PKI48656.1 hypothetical protein CRG98_030943 [Punica granatum]
MSSTVSRDQTGPCKGQSITIHDADANSDRVDDLGREEEEDVPENLLVSTHVYIKPVHSSEQLDREVVLRRFRQRKRANRVRSALARLFVSPFREKADGKAVKPDQPKRWVDDAFAAP